ncbi:MAG TPA: AMP-binding protein [Anaerolineales bacterium]|nr:AMP-binding protein [Anaerolineales bacterium]
MSSRDFHDTSIDALLRAQARTYGNRVFVKENARVWSYAEAEEHAGALAGGMRALGLAPGDRLAVILPNLGAYVITAFAAAWAGLILVPVNVRRSREELLARLSKTRPRAVVTFSDPDEFKGMDHLQAVLDLKAGLPDLEHVIAVGAVGRGAIDWDDLSRSNPRPPAPMADAQRPAAILHTLGSSGEPRGAVLTHRALVRNAAGIAQTLECSSNDVFLGAVPLTNAFGLAPTILACAVSGAQLVPLKRYNPGLALALIASAGVTVHHGVPTMFALELNHPDFHSESCRSLRTGIVSGAPCPPELVTEVRQRMGCNLLIGYGLTEASPSVCLTRLDDGPVTATQTVGRPMEGVEVRVVGPDGATLPTGQEGELHVRGYNIMQGYWEDDEATRQVLVDGGWLRTGDLAVVDADGPLRILGRKDDVINRGGFKVHPGTIEMVLRSHPAVRDAAVFGIPDVVYGEITCACVVRWPERQAPVEALLSYLRERLPDYAVPDRVLFFDALPRLGSGPLRMAYLRERVRIRGAAWKFGKNIDTDAIIPARRCNTSDPRELAQYCMEDADPEFVHKMRRGDVIVAETNFGCGSSREVAPITIRAAGISAVIAKSFARIFFRNAINIGLPILECPAAVDGIQQGDEIEVEPATGIVRNLSRAKVFQAQPYPEFLQRIIERGGLLGYVEERLADVGK